jgi:hypothetical protein
MLPVKSNFSLTRKPTAFGGGYVLMALPSTYFCFQGSVGLCAKDPTGLGLKPPS